MNDQDRRWTLKVQQRDLKHVLQRPVETTADSRHLIGWRFFK